MDYVLKNRIELYGRSFLRRIFRNPLRDTYGKHIDSVWYEREIKMEVDNAERLESWKVKVSIAA